MKRNPALNGIRGMAMLSVVMDHARGQGLAPAPWINFEGAGPYGVYLFFTLSAYLLTKQIIEDDTSLSSKPIYWLNYAMRRFLRIYPVYTVVLFLYLAMKESDITTFGRVVEQLTLQRGRGIFWTIPVEFKYYAALPFVAYALILFKPKPLLGVAFFALVILGFHRFFPPVGGLGFAPFICFFLLGSLSAFVQSGIERRSSPVTESRAFRMACELTAFACLAIAVVHLPSVRALMLGQPVMYNAYHLYYLRFALLWSLLLLGTLNGTGVLRRFFSTRAMDFFGKISFSAYMTHILIRDALLHYLPANGLTWAVFMALALAVAWVSFRTIEQPLSRIDLLRKARVQPSTVAAPDARPA